MSNEWFTPAKYIEAAREVMGSIDLDPASCELANQTVKSTRYFTQEDNGLVQEWKAKNLWLNPPYSAEALINPIRFWISKLISEYEQGNVEQAMVLVTAGSERKWFQPLWQHPICFPNHQIVFNRLNDVPAHKRQSNCFVYLGPNEQKFTEVFSKFGTMVKRVSLPVEVGAA